VQQDIIITSMNWKGKGHHIGYKDTDSIGLHTHFLIKF